MIVDNFIFKKYFQFSKFELPLCRFWYHTSYPESVIKGNPV